MPRPSSLSAAGAVAATAFLLAGCEVGPDYHQPSVPMTTTYKETPSTWKKAEPQDAISKGDWYTIFKDPKLNELEDLAQHQNQNLRAAQARVSESRALARQSEADLMPEIDFNATGERQRISPNNGETVAQAGGGLGKPVPHTFNEFTAVPFDLSYEVDIWGRLRRAFEASADTAQASLADYENVLLMLKADVATNYFALREADSEIDVQLNSIKAFQDALNLTQSRFTGGIATELDVDQAKATLAAAQSQLGAFRQNRAQLEHAIAVDLGEAPAAFSLPHLPLSHYLPEIPPGLPSDLLERRPDIAAAERRVAAQNAQIGVAVGAYFPVVRLTGETGFDSGDIGLLFNWESHIWSYGPSITFPIFEGGRIEADIKQQRAAYEENVADYRQSVLVAFQDVEDSLSSLHYLADQAEAENRAYQSYQRALELTNARYSSGLVSYFDVITAEGDALNAQQSTVQLAGNRLAATVRLIKAMGGGWNNSLVLRPDRGDHEDAPSHPPTVLGPTANQGVPQAAGTSAASVERH
jgi:multidrug efflux system outer membrane protein